MISVAEILSNHYDSVVTNPPYMGSSGMDGRLSKFVKDAYPSSKADLSTCFMEKTLSICSECGFMSMINIPVWMFLSSFETLRKIISTQNTYINMAHQGRGIFGSDFGSTAFVIAKNHINCYRATYVKLFDKQGAVDSVEEKESKFFSGDNRFYVKQDRFDAIPGSPIAYWTHNSLIDCFSHNPAIGQLTKCAAGVSSGDNEKYLRIWTEVNYTNIAFECENDSDFRKTSCSFVPCNKGGPFRKWYGNNNYVANWKKSNEYHRNGATYLDLLFKEGITWSAITSSKFSARYYPPGLIFDHASPSLFADCDMYYYLGLVNSVVASYILSIINPTINTGADSLRKIPVVNEKDNHDIITSLVKNNIKGCKEDWDSYELSWDYVKDPLILCNNNGLIESSYNQYHSHCIDNRNEVQKNEEEINRIFIETYGLINILQPDVERDDVSIIVPEINMCIKNLVSYAIGCMFGRYSLDYLGLQFAGGDFKPKEQRFMPDPDNIIPINDNEYFSDDIVSRFVEFIRIAFGDEHLEENLKFIANNLGVKGKGTSREIIRKYFLNDFYKDHLKMYSNLPIYWLFDSGKENSFKALIYMHRYDENLIAKMRQDYLLPMYRRYNEMFESEKDLVERSELEKKINELSTYDLAMELYSTEKVSIDLDDGVKVNYAKFQNIDNPGGKGKINLLYKLK